MSGESKGTRHPDLTTSRITKDEENVISLLGMFKQIWLNSFDSQATDSCNVSTGAVPEIGVVMKRSLNRFCYSETFTREKYQIFRYLT